MCALGSAHCASNKARFRGNKHQINSDKTSGSSTWVCKLTCSIFHLSPQHKGSNNKYFTVLIHFHKYSEASTHWICIFTPLCMQPLVLRTVLAAACSCWYCLQYQWLYAHRAEYLYAQFAQNVGCIQCLTTLQSECKMYGTLT